MERPKTDLLDLLAAGDPPAFGSDENHRIVFWNRGAERTLGRPAAQALGRRCHDVLAGRDVFGNRFCYAGCPITETMRQRESVNPLELEVACSTGKRLLGVTTYQVPGREHGAFTLVHVLQPIDEAGRLARILGRLKEPAEAPRAAPESLPLRPAGPVRPAGARPSAQALTSRELEVMGCVAAGLQNKEVAQALGISVATARNHVHRVLEKLGVHSKLEALSLCLRDGWADELVVPAPRTRARPVLPMAPSEQSATPALHGVDAGRRPA